MSSTVWEYGDLPSGVMAQGYRYRNEVWSAEELLHDGPFGAMGGLITTAGDFARYAIMHLSAWPPRDSEEVMPLRRSSLRRCIHLHRELASAAVHFIPAARIVM
ncbi:MAG: hypothetical protein R2758_09925 [Bacteroidales bacterium]